MRSAGAGCRLQTCRRGDPQRFNSAFPAMTFGGGRAGNRIPRGALSSVEERPFRIREVEGSNPSVSTFLCARTAPVPHTGVEVSNLSVSTFLCAPASCAVVPKRLRGWTRNPLGSARAGSSPAVCVLLEKLSRRESNPGHPRDRRVY